MAKNRRYRNSQKNGFLGLGNLFKGRQTVAGSMFFSSKAEYLPVNYETLVTQGYRKNEIIFACVEKKAHTASQVRLQVQDADGNHLKDHPLQKLIKQPNPAMTEFEFWRTISATNDLGGDCYFEIERSGSGKPVALWWLRPDWVSVIPPKITPENRAQMMRKYPDGIMRYEYGAPGEDKIPLEKRDVLVFPEFDPLNERRGWPRAAVAARVGQADNVATDVVTNLMENGGIPNGILKTKKTLKGNQADDIRERWVMRYGGMINSLKGPAVLDGDAEYQQVQQDMQKMNFAGLDKRAEVRICMVMGVPPVIIGALIGLLRSTYDNVREAQKLWWHNELIPRYEHLDDQIMLRLVPEYGENIQLQWDFSRVPALQEDTKEIWDRARYAFTDGIVTINEAREMVGKEADAENGNQYVWEVLRSVQDTLSSDAGASDEGEKHVFLADRIKAMQKNKGQPQGLSLQKDDSENDILTYGSKAHAAYMERKDAEIEPFEEKMQEIALDEFERQLKDVTERLESESAKADFKSLPDAYALFPLEEEVDAWYQAFEEELKKAIAALGEGEMIAVGGTEFSIDRPNVVEAIEVILSDLALKTNNTTYQALIGVIQEAETEGLDVPALQERINDYFGGRMKPYETERIARTTMTEANGFASMEAWEQSELVENKVWMSELRSNTRDAHRNAHGQRVGLKEFFTVGGELLMYPGDADGSAENVINCLCRMLPVLKEE